MSVCMYVQERLNGSVPKENFLEKTVMCDIYINSHKYATYPRDEHIIISEWGTAVLIHVFEV